MVLKFPSPSHSAVGVSKLKQQQRLHQCQCPAGPLYASCRHEAKMDLVAPNLAALIGEIIGARLISHAGGLPFWGFCHSSCSNPLVSGPERLNSRILNLLDRMPGSLTNLAKYPASTVQILGAEKALFRALKTKVPKGLK